MKIILLCILFLSGLAIAQDQDVIWGYNDWVLTYQVILVESKELPKHASYTSKPMTYEKCKQVEAQKIQALDLSPDVESYSIMCEQLTQRED